jgi:hypothetical protein
MSTTTINSAHVTSQPLRNTTSQQRHSVPSSKTTTKKEAHLGITISWAGAPWPAPGTRPALLISKSGELILFGGAGC